MGVKFGSISGYLYLDTWVMATVIHLATIDYCKRFVTYKEDPCGRQYDQMTQAARSISANIAEGSSRHQTSYETELRLLDVARASISEVSYYMLCELMTRNACAWSKTHPDWTMLHNVRLDRPTYSSDLMHDVTAHILAQKRKFDRWFMSDDPLVFANAIVVLCGRLIRMLQRQLEYRHNEFAQQGGFTENLTEDRLAVKKEHSLQSNAPECPKCGSVMILQTVKKGTRSGQRFWGCSNYPRCNGTRNFS